jgi:hypothetical protein
VDWSGAARGPRGFDVGWCRLDLYLLFGERIADVFLAVYENAIGHPLADVPLWDWLGARPLARRGNELGAQLRAAGAAVISTSESFDGATRNGPPAA